MRDRVFTLFAMRMPRTPLDVINLRSHVTKIRIHPITSVRVLMATGDENGNPT